MQTTTKQQIKERPILFSSEMVRAILEGRKTQTRRVAKPFNPPQFDADAVHEISPGEFIGWSGPHTPKPSFTQKIYNPGSGIVCPYGKPGDRLWVRETWNQFGGEYAYAATDADVYPESKWRPSIHMPRAASRIFLEIESVRVERVQDISEHDAIAEGIEGRYHPEYPTLWTWRDYDSKERFSYGTAVYPKSVFKKLWQSINGPESWQQNPWVWVVEFKRIEP